MKYLAIRICLCVVRDSMTNFMLTGNREKVINIPKFWRYLIGLFPRKAFPSSFPYLYSVTRPKSVYSDDLTASQPVKQSIRLKPDLL
jgi:hypothetical protein